MAAPEWMIYAQSFFALLFVAGLIVLCSLLARKAGFDRKFSGAKSSVRRLAVVETLYIDPRRRLVLVKRDAKEHLLLLGASGDRVVESVPDESGHV